MKKILFLNHKEARCGVYQYGYRVANIIKHSTEYDFIYHEVDSLPEYYGLVNAIQPSGIIYNHHQLTMSWLTNNEINNQPGIKHYKLHHESYSPNFNYIITQDPTVQSANNLFSTPRPLFNFTTDDKDLGNIPIIGSFGFGFQNKGFARLCEVVNTQFDNAIINLQITFAFFGDKNGEMAQMVSNQCRSKITKPGIKLNISHDFLTNDEILMFLSLNTINVFLYDEMPADRGISSVIDYALSVKRPIAITKTHMFRHIYNTEPSICVENNSLQNIIDNGCEILNQYRDLWSTNNLIKTYDDIINKTL